MSETHGLISNLSASLFWNVKRSSVDAEAHADFLIRRVMERGTSRDVRLAWKHYRANKVQDALIKAPALSRKTIHFFANQFGIPCEAFRANQRAQNWAR
ncbi:MAG: hypothetical protein ACI8ZW_000991 [Yoonia sp.]|jgi:hypothetical protein